MSSKTYLCPSDENTGGYMGERRPSWVRAAANQAYIDLVRDIGNDASAIRTKLRAHRGDERSCVIRYHVYVYGASSVLRGGLRRTV